MKQVLIIGSRESGTKNNPTTLARSLDTAGTSVTVAYWEDMVFDIRTDDVKIYIENGQDILSLQPSLVIAVGWYKSGPKSIYRDIAYSLALYLTHHHIPFWNSEMGQQRSTTKLSCMVKLALEDISVPHTLFSLDLANVKGRHTVPCVVKAASASRGRSNFLVKTEDDFEKLLSVETAFLVQPYLENSYDLRVICMNGSAQLILRRERAENADTHLNNTSQGGSARWIDLGDISEELLTISTKVCKVMNREMAGIDFIPDAASSVGYSCLEVNAIPQLTSGFDTNKKMQAFVEAVTKTIGE